MGSMRVPASMRDAVSGTTGDHLVIGTNQLACWVLCDQPRGTRTRVARAILENSTTIPKRARDDFGRLRLGTQRPPYDARARLLRRLQGNLPGALRRF